MRLSQLIAIVRYEVKMQWHQQGLPMLALAFVVGLSLITLWVRAATEEQVAEWTTDVMMTGWPVVLVLSILAIPPIVADAIPKDRQIGLRELIDSLPLSPGWYLTGKILGVWAGVLVGLMGVAVLYGLGGWLFYGPYDIGIYLLLWLVGIVPLVLFTSGMSALLAVGQPNRRRATFVGMAFAAYCLAMSVTTTGTVSDAVSLARPSVFLVLHGYVTQNTFLGLVTRIGLASYPPTQIPLTIGLGALQVALA